MQASYEPSAPKGVTDDYRCFLLDPANAADSFVTSARIEPGQPKIVHHVILFRVAVRPGRLRQEPRQRRCGTGLVVLRRHRSSGRRRRRDRRLAEQRELDRRLGAGLGRQPPPGRHGRVAPRRKPDRDAGALQPAERTCAGSLASAAHRRARVGEARAAADRAAPGAGRAGMREGRAREALRPQRGALRPGQEVRRPRPRSRLPASSSSAAGAPPTRRPSAVSTCERRITTPTTIYVAAGHMHLLGSSIRLELNPGTSRAKVLLDIPRWDFHWQNAYTLARPVRGRARRRRAGHVPPRREQADARRPRRAYDAALRPLGRGNDRRDVPRDPPGHARVALLRILLVSQMYPGPQDPGPRGLRGQPRARARRTRTRDRARGRRLAGRRTTAPPRALPRRRARSEALPIPTSPTRTSSSPRDLRRRSRRARRSSSPRTARTSRTSARPRAFALRRDTSFGARPPSSPSRAGFATASSWPCPTPAERPRSSTAASTSSASRRATPRRPAATSAGAATARRSSASAASRSARTSSASRAPSSTAARAR